MRKNIKYLLPVFGLFFYQYIPYITPVAQVECYFTPGENCQNIICHKIDGAQKSIFIQAYSFTDKNILEKIINKHNKGVQVEFIFDYNNSKAKYSSDIVQKILENDINILLDRPAGCAHNKVMIIDDEVVITGSYNFTNNAHKRNVENLVILHDKKIAKKYKNNWLYRADKSQKLLVNSLEGDD